ncbi:sonic hedgehog protein-like [Oratosquilla oratoria]|uniref:sonic hedgehog protein-like n=1 Tax=Oratosquilla oratoria TaxID=337810 RepID=UPI003F768044
MPSQSGEVWRGPSRRDLAMGPLRLSRSSAAAGRWRPQAWPQVYACVLVLSILCSEVQCCGPGRGGGGRRGPRKLRPLVFKQHVPNVSENTLGASGLTEGAIGRNDPRFQDLVPNYNSDIIFRDEEGTGADRIMTERCMERLNTLAISVMNQWPGVKLRVSEGWDEERRHAKQSLHYEGRAVDITTSDKDRSKYGMLARLAVEAGFDWVYYESRSHIHCSVKSESSEASRMGGCFPGQGQVTTPTGQVEISSLKEGDLVQVLRSDGTLAFSPVIMFLHRDQHIHRHFLTLVTSGGSELTLTPSHLVLMMPRQSASSSSPTVSEALANGGAILAGRVQIGDYLLVTGPTGELSLQEVTDVKSAFRDGVFAPLTTEGTVVVDGVVASCYAIIDSQVIAHWAFLPVRIYNNLKQAALELLRALRIPKFSIASSSGADMSTSQSAEITGNEVEGSGMPHIHWYPKLLYKMAVWLLPHHLVYS